MPNPKNKQDKKSSFQLVRENVKSYRIGFVFFFKPNPSDHWSVQLIKTLAKLPLLVLLILLSPILIVVLLIIFLIAL